MYLFFLLLLFIVSPVQAQDQVDLYSQYKSDYLFLQNEYQRNYLDYLNKKNVYIQYKTITSEKDKIESTKITLLSRNNMLKSFLMTLRVGLDKYKMMNPVDTQKYQIQLKKWEEWLDEQNLIIPNLENSIDISNWADTFKSRYIEIQQVIYTALTQSKVNLCLFNLNDINLLANAIKSDPENTYFTDDWFANFPIKSDLITDSLRQAIAATQIPQTGRNFVDFYPEVRLQTNKADTYLKSLLVDLKSVTIKPSN